MTRGSVIIVEGENLYILSVFPNGYLVGRSMDYGKNDFRMYVTRL